MGFFKDLGSVVGGLAGMVLALPVELVGEVTDSKFIKDVADGVFQATANTGEILGTIAEGTVKCASGIIQQDSKQAEEGLGEVVETTAKTAVGIGFGVAKTISNGVETVVAISEGDTDKAINTGKEILKVVAVGALGVGICDIVGGLDADNDGIPDFLERDNVSDVHIARGGNPNGGTGPGFVYENEPPVYWVDAPHTQNGGYYRTMPDASISNNLSSKV